MTIHYTQTKWIGKKTLVGKTEFNSNAPLHLLIGFHGAESTPENMLVHGNRLNLTNTILAFPEGPIDAGGGRFSWWKDGSKQKETVKEFLNFSTEMIQYGYSQLKECHPEIECVTSLWGFSQGAAAALVYALLGSHPIHKVASVCGFLPEIPDLQKNRHQTASILGIFGNNDLVVPSFLAEHALEEMKNWGHH